MKAPIKNFFELQCKDLKGNPFLFSGLKDKKVILIVNVASQWGLTKEHYTNMGPAYDKWSSKGLEILGFPCNQFGKQEPGTPEEIEAFVRGKYNCTFPLMEKIDVNGPNTHPVYAFLKENSELYDQKTEKAEDISWNFAKFVVNHEGKVIKYLNPKVQAKTALEFIEDYLGKLWNYDLKISEFD